MKKIKQLAIFTSLLSIFTSNIFSQQKYIPVLPESNKNLIYYEAENAIVTNFSTSPTLNYSASSQRTLQLNTYNSNYKSNAYFSEYVIYIDDPGNYNFWYSGTPPGTKEDIYPSYSSPFTLVIDDKIVNIYREDVNVVEAYAPGLYWIKTENFDLEKGYHKVRFEVKEKRRFDGKFYFYLDSFFLFNGDETNPGLTPDVFPKDMNNRAIDNAFNSISYYQNIIKNNPNSTPSYMSLSHIYILIGDYLNAIKMLTRILQIDPKNRDAKLLLAKSRIWSGENDRGIRDYESYLELYPENLAVWEEAGKIAAWIGELNKSIDIFNRGLSVFPDSNSLKINLALTYLWNSNIQEGLDILSTIENSSNDDVDKIKNIASIYRINGYPDYAVKFYNNKIREYPDIIQLYLELEKIYSSLGDIENSNLTINKIESIFTISDELAKILDYTRKQASLRDHYIEELENSIELDPTNLDQRELLVQTYFWNGIVDKAILEYKSILTINHSLSMAQFEKESIDLFIYYDILKYIDIYINNSYEDLTNLKNELLNAIIKYRTSIINNSEIEESKSLLNEIINRLNITLGRSFIVNEEFKLINSMYKDIISQENELETIFSNLTMQNNWRLNLNYLISELEEVSEVQSSSEIANNILERVHLVFKSKNKKKRDINNSDEIFTQNSLLEYHKKLWNNIEPDKVALTELSFLYPGMIAEQEFINKLNSDISPVIELNDDFLKNIPSIIELIGSEQRKVITLQKSLKNKTDEVILLISNKLTRAIYNHQENTYLIRYNIGDYYLQQEEYSKALEQFNLVISIDPFNTTTNFKIGRLQQLTGSWKEALESYEGVYRIDSDFKSAASMFNNLSSQHPDLSSGNLEYFTDSNRVDYKSEFTTDFNIKSWFKISPVWKENSYIYYKWSEIGAPRKYKVDTFMINSQISLFENKTLVEPGFGATIYNNKYNEILPNSSFDIADILSSNIIYPYINLKLNNNINNFSVNIALEQGILHETIPNNIKNINSIAQKYSISGYFPLSNAGNINSLSFRTYFSLDNRSGYNDNNNIYTLAQDFVVGLLLAKNPWTTLQIYNSTTYENSDIIKKNLYYTPDSVFVSKIGGTVSSFIGLMGGVFSINSRLGAGIYIDKLGRESVSSFATDGDLLLSFNKDNRNIFLKLFGSGSFSNSIEPDYWSFQASIGFNISMFKTIF